MRSFIQLLLLISAFSVKASALPLKSGDLILEPISCYLCNLIEAETESPYAHMGVLIQNQGTWNVLEAWGTVRMTPLTEFLSRKKKDVPSLVLRVNSNLIIHTLRAGELLARFKDQFEGHTYDSQFLWNNSDEHGEKLYCSEFAEKFLAVYLSESLAVQPMHFQMNRELWVKFFHGNPPDGAPGLSPGDFERSTLFHKVGTL